MNSIPDEHAEPSTSTRFIPLWPAKLPLMRPQRGRWIAGVARGISLHLGIPVVWIRLLFLLGSCMYGASLVAYIALWVFIPPGDPYVEATRLAARRPQPSQAPLAKGNIPYASLPLPQSSGSSQEPPDYTGLQTNEDTSVSPVENLHQTLSHSFKPALFALAGIGLITIAILVHHTRGDNPLLVPGLLAIIGIGIAWLRFNAHEGQIWTSGIGVSFVFIAYVLFMTQTTITDGFVPFTSSILGGFALLAGVICALIPWMIALFRTMGHERALKEREEERADMTAHLHDGVLQTLALIQLHADDPQQVFSLARSQERELRSWLYQERTTTDRSVNAGLQEIAAHIEDAHGKAIDVVTVGDARPSAQTDALLDAAAQAMINAVTHGGEPISVYCEATEKQVEVFVRDHGKGFNVDQIPEGRLGIRESIIGRIRRRGGTVEIVSRPHWGTEVRMHMPIANQDYASSHES